MLNWLAKRADVARKAENLYGAVVAQARQPAFYADFDMPDTLEGRYEMIVLHIFLVLERLRQAMPEDTKLARALIERFVTDMDDCMREIGVGDLTVPKKVKQAAAGLYKRADAYRSAHASGGEAMIAALDGMFAELPAQSIRTRELSQYVNAAIEALNGQDIQELLMDAPAFPAPETYAPRKGLGS